MALGEVVFDDASYAGETGDSVFSVQYYRNKVNEFQSAMVAADEGYRALADSYDALLYIADDDLLLQISDLMNQYDDKRSYIVATAEAINLASSGLNASGIRFPVVSTSGLGAIPLVGIAAVVATAAAVIVWIKTWLDNSAQTQRLALSITNADQDTKNRIAMNLAASQAALDKAKSNPLTDVANIVKWVAIAAGGFMAYKIFMEHRGKS